MMSAAVAGPTTVRPIASYTTLRDVTLGVTARVIVVLLDACSRDECSLRLVMTPR